MASGVTNIRAMGEPRVQHDALDHAQWLKDTKTTVPDSCKSGSVARCIEAVCKSYNGKPRNIYSDNNGAGNILGHLTNCLQTRATANLGAYAIYGVADYFHMAICEELPPPDGLPVLAADPVRVPAAGCSKANVADARSWLVVLGGFLVIAGLRGMTAARPETASATLPLMNAIYVWMGWADHVIPNGDLVIDSGA